MNKLYRLKFSLIDSNGELGWRCSKFGVGLKSYLGNYSVLDDGVYLGRVFILNSKYGKVVEFLQGIENDKTTLRLENVEKNSYFFLMKKPTEQSLQRLEPIFYSTDIFHSKPVEINNKGIEVWDIISPTKERLEEIMNKAKESYQGKLNSLEEI